MMITLIFKKFSLRSHIKDIWIAWGWCNWRVQLRNKLKTKKSVKAWLKQFNNEYQASVNKMFVIDLVKAEGNSGMYQLCLPIALRLVCFNIYLNIYHCGCIGGNSGCLLWTSVHVLWADIEIHFYKLISISTMYYTTTTTT